MRYVPDGSLCAASAEQIFPRDSVQRNCFELALYTARDHDCISNRIGSGIRTLPRCRCRLATFAALPTPSMIERAIIMLTDHRFWGHASGPSSSGKTPPIVPSITAMPLAAAPYRASGLVQWRKRTLGMGRIGTEDPAVAHRSECFVGRPKGRCAVELPPRWLAHRLLRHCISASAPLAEARGVVGRDR